jgi:hypothetical protein
MIFRQVFTDGRSLPTVTEPSWLGYSVGRWDGDTFVVESAGFKDRGWLDTQKGRPHSDALRVIERFRRRDFGHIDLAITIDDSKAFVKPFTITTQLTYQAAPSCWSRSATTTRSRWNTGGSTRHRRSLQVRAEAGLKTGGYVGARGSP